MFHTSLDPQSLNELVRMQGFKVLLDPAVTQALTSAGQLLVGAAQANAESVFENPTGALSDSINFWVASPNEVQVIVGVPYGQRRERGFSGMTDALGRFYANDPAKPYAQPAVDDNRQAVRDLMAAATNVALGRMATG